MVYNDGLKIKDALQLYFSKYHFVNGGYDLKFFRIKLGPAFIPLPNIKARVAAVKIHDIHHLVTEYPATLKGEAEIGAWEIASGCGKYYVAWLLNFGSFFYGILFFPKALFRAFLNGRRSKLNLYHHTCYNEHLLNQTVGEIRGFIRTGELRKNSIMDYLYFILSCLLTMAAAFCFFYPVYVIAHKLFTLFP